MGFTGGRSLGVGPDPAPVHCSLPGLRRRIRFDSAGSSQRIDGRPPRNGRLRRKPETGGDVIKSMAVGTRRFVGPRSVDLGRGVLPPPFRSRATASAATPGAQVGFWAERTRSTQKRLPMDQTYWFPPDTHELTPAVWSVLAQYHAPLYLALDYKRDFGPIPPGEPHCYDGLRLIQAANRRDVPGLLGSCCPMPMGCGQTRELGLTRFDGQIDYAA